jgi:transposase
MAILSRLPAIESIPASDWRLTLRERAENLAQGEEIDKDALETILRETGATDEKADRYHQRLMEKAINDLRS